MARCLIVGCGCRGRALGEALIERGHAVRGTSRDPDAAAELEAAGIEPVIGDPDRVVTLAPAFEHVSVVFVLMGSATGPAEALGALHGSRLEMLLTKLIDTTVRGIVYESAGTVDAAVLAGGAERVRAACEDSLIPYALLDTPPGEFEPWRAAALAAVDSVLGG